jgi:hypothetical protein
MAYSELCRSFDQFSMLRETLSLHFRRSDSNFCVAILSPETEWEALFHSPGCPKQTKSQNMSLHSVAHMVHTAYLPSMDGDLFRNHKTSYRIPSMIFIVTISSDANNFGRYLNLLFLCWDNQSPKQWHIVTLSVLSRNTIISFTPGHIIFTVNCLNGCQLRTLCEMEWLKR